jgi:succinate dehydrogenase/fumarate reductase-like Fe-S protein
VTRLDGLGDTVVVEPLAGLPVVGDLVVDMEELYQRLEPAGRPLVRASERARPGASGVATHPALEELEPCPMLLRRPRS